MGWLGWLGVAYGAFLTIQVIVSSRVIHRLQVQIDALKAENDVLATRTYVLQGRLIDLGDGPAGAIPPEMRGNGL